MRTTTLFALLFAAVAARAQTPPPVCPPPATQAFTGCYYGNTTLSGDPVLIRTDKDINFDWENGSPDPSLQPLNFSARWQGNFVFAAADYTFTLIFSDGIRFYLDGNLAFEKWTDGSALFYNLTKTLSAGNHVIKVEYYEKSGGATAQVTWKSNGTVTAPPPPVAPAVISSFTATPSAAAPGQQVTLAWNVSGATNVTVDNGIGDVTSKTSVTVTPAATTTYTLTATGSTGAVTAQTTVIVSSGAVPDTQAPTSPSLVSAIAKSATEVDLTWLASTDNVAVAGYQILRNGSPIASTGASTGASALSYADTSVIAGVAYTYSVKAFDAAGNYSAAGNSIQVTTPSSSTPSGACPAAATGAWTACYYSNTSLSGNTILVRTDNQLNFDYLNFPPDPSVPARNFSVRWQGNFVLNPGTYTFTVVAGDGIRLLIDGQPLLNNWVDHYPTAYTVTQAVSAGTHLIEVDHYEANGGDVVQVSWKNTSAAPNAPLISSFTANANNVAAGQPVTLSWSVSGGTSISIDNGVGDVTTRSSAVVNPVQTTTWTITATNTQGVSSASVTVTVPVSGPALATPTLVSAVAKSANEVDLTWIAGTASSIASYGIVRNGWQLTTVPASQNTYVDTDVYTSSNYTYSIRAYDAAGNYSSQSNSVQVMTPNASDISVTWYGGCWLPATFYGITGNYQEVDFALRTSKPVPLQGTLFDGPNCTAQGGDNMNDFNTLTGTTHMLQGFSHNADIMPTSAIFWIGERTPDGKCPAGSTLCSPCYNYDKNTPLCSTLP